MADDVFLKLAKSKSQLDQRYASLIDYCESMTKLSQFSRGIAAKWQYLSPKIKALESQVNERVGGLEQSMLIFLKEKAEVASLSDSDILMLLEEDLKNFSLEKENTAQQCKIKFANDLSHQLFNDYLAKLYELALWRARRFQLQKKSAHLTASHHQRILFYGTSSVPIHVPEGMAIEDAISQHLSKTMKEATCHATLESSNTLITRPDEDLPCCDTLILETEQPIETRVVHYVKEDSKRNRYENTAIYFTPEQIEAIRANTKDQRIVGFGASEGGFGLHYDTIPDARLLLWAATLIENRIATYGNVMVLRNNHLPQRCLRAIILYCASNDYALFNLSGYHFEPSVQQKKASRECLAHLSAKEQPTGKLNSSSDNSVDNQLTTKDWRSILFTHPQIEKLATQQIESENIRVKKFGG